LTARYAVHPDEQVEKLKGALLKDIQRSAFVYRVDCGGCNGCEIEIFAAITPLFDAERFGIKVVSSPRHADILLYTGAVTRSMRVPALRAYHAAPDPKICVAYGACGCSGGIFHDLYCVGRRRSDPPIDAYIRAARPAAQFRYGSTGPAQTEGSHHIQGRTGRSPASRIQLDLRIESKGAREWQLLVWEKDRRNLSDLVKR
jgi:hydrogenase-4 component I